MKQVKQIIVMAFIAVAVAAGFFPSQAGAWGRGHFYVIGIGPSGPQMATLQALDTIKQMDTIIAPEQHVKLFSEYIGDKPVLFDPWKGFWDYNGKSYSELTKEEYAKFKVERFRLRDERAEQIKKHLEKGKNVGLLDSGNPCLFGPSHWYVEEFDKQDIVIIPGMGCDAAAMAALGKSIIPAYKARFVMQSAPMFLMDHKLEDRQILKDLSKYPVNMIQYMALGNPEKTFSALGEMYKPDTPCAVVFWAGYPGRERILRGTVGDMAQKLSNEKEKFMGLLFVGDFLEGKPYEASMKLQNNEK
ncbi:SAM-dependent methyltransferase [Desulfonema magnum]|uniref:Tetrapyrrole methylase n=1 Tax=Desulfonema magnum TaxID=45655 RepID=A0A975BVN2_9BACT|nr:SAM-dependent methyltransferase [Desulfonema magnum]QTA92584.1 Tetrapyrrole methylase [Desulfonema magnum]